jgi:hypothetical protein
VPGPSGIPAGLAPGAPGRASIEARLKRCSDAQSRRTGAPWLPLRAGCGLFIHAARISASRAQCLAGAVVARWKQRRGTLLSPAARGRHARRGRPTQGTQPQPPDAVESLVDTARLQGSRCTPQESLLHRAGLDSVYRCGPGQSFVASANQTGA